MQQNSKNSIKSPGFQFRAQYARCTNDRSVIWIISSLIIPPPFGLAGVELRLNGGNGDLLGVDEAAPQCQDQAQRRPRLHDALGRSHELSLRPVHVHLIIFRQSNQCSKCFSLGRILSHLFLRLSTPPSSLGFWHLNSM